MHQVGQMRGTNTADQEEWRSDQPKRAKMPVRGRTSKAAVRCEEPGRLGP